MVRQDLAIAAPSAHAQSPQAHSPCPPLSGNPPSVLTSQYDNCRDAYNPTETALTPTSVPNLTASSLLVDNGDLPLNALSNPIYAQPLYVAGASLANKKSVNYAGCQNLSGKCNILVAVTLNDTVFAWNADTGAILWSIQAGSVGKGAPNYVTQPPLWSGDCSPVGGPVNQYTQLPFVGVLSTPVIDKSGPDPMMFLTSLCTNGQQNNRQWFIHKIDLKRIRPDLRSEQHMPSDELIELRASAI